MREPLPLTPITVLHKPAIRCKPERVISNHPLLFLKRLFNSFVKNIFGRHRPNLNTAF